MKKRGNGTWSIGPQEGIEPPLSRSVALEVRVHDNVFACVCVHWGHFIGCYFSILVLFCLFCDKSMQSFLPIHKCQMQTALYIQR